MKTITRKEIRSLQGGDDLENEKYVGIEELNGKKVVWGYAETPNKTMEDSVKWINQYNLNPTEGISDPNDVEIFEIITDRSLITSEKFNNKLQSIVDEMSGSEVFGIPGVYEIVAEYLNNEVLEALDKEANWFN